MKFGTFNLHAVPEGVNPSDVIREHFDQAIAAESAGFDEIWLAEHNGRRYGLLGNAVIAAAAIAVATKRIRVATAVTRLPLHNPVHLAEDLGYVDTISGGRMDFGVGKGYDELEFSTYGVPYDELNERWAEAYDAIEQIWRTGRTAFDGRFWQLGDGELLPPPLQGQSVPTYAMVSRSHDSMRWAAERLLPVAIGSGPTIPEVRELLAVYREAAAAAGHAPEAIEETLAQTWQLKQVHVAPSTDQAIEEFREGLMWYFSALGNRAMFQFSRESQPYEYYIRHEAVLVGSSQTVLERLATYRAETGVHNIICWFNVGGQPHEQVLRALAQFGAEVIPELS
jgi:alkanesulfonate monooxygenase SsuD/methylene tetrahydromethanopterin reductase-like flavin-dependent oxidoreductase (luciferase family)